MKKAILTVAIISALLISLVGGMQVLKTVRAGWIPSTLLVEYALPAAIAAATTAFIAAFRVRKYQQETLRSHQKKNATKQTRKKQTQPN